MILGMSFVQLAIAVVIIAAVVALVLVAMRHMGVSPPSWAMQVLWIVVIAVVVIFAIKFIAGAAL